MTDYPLEVLIARFKDIGPGEIARWFSTPNNCIAAVRIIEQVFAKFGIEVRPLPCRFICHAPSLNKMYIASPHDEVWDGHYEAHATEVHDKRTPDNGWQGHLVALLPRQGERGYWLLDPTWGTAGEYLGFNAEGGCLECQLPPEYDPAQNCIRLEVETSAGLRLRISYEPVEDRGYETTPAWELDHLEPAIGMLWRRMNGAQPETFKQFVIYRRPRDFPMASIVVRRWQLIGGQCVPDVKPAMVLGGPEEKALEFARERLAAKGLIRWERFLQDDPTIVEVWF